MKWLCHKYVAEGERENFSELLSKHVEHKIQIRGSESVVLGKEKREENEIKDEERELYLYSYPYLTLNCYVLI